MVSKKLYAVGIRGLAVVSVAGLVFTYQGRGQTVDGGGGFGFDNNSSFTNNTPLDLQDAVTNNPSATATACEVVVHGPLAVSINDFLGQTNVVDQAAQGFQDGMNWVAGSASAFFGSNALFTPPGSGLSFLPAAEAYSLTQAVAYIGPQIALITNGLGFATNGVGYAMSNGIASLIPAWVSGTNGQISAEEGTYSGGFHLNLDAATNGTGYGDTPLQRISHINDGVSYDINPFHSSLWFAICQISQRLITWGAFAWLWWSAFRLFVDSTLEILTVPKDAASPTGGGGFMIGFLTSKISWFFSIGLFLFIPAYVYNFMLTGQMATALGNGGITVADTISTSGTFSIVGVGAQILGIVGPALRDCLRYFCELVPVNTLVAIAISYLQYRVLLAGYFISYGFILKVTGG